MKPHGAGGLRWILFASLLFMLGCVATPPPRSVYKDTMTSIAIQADPRAGGGHSHPAHITTEQMKQVLDGVRTQARKGYVSSLATGTPELVPAFNKLESQTLAPLLSKALEQAKPDELVTFYRRFSDTNIGLAITSGGMFVEGTHMYFVLANNRTLPSAGMNQNMVYEIDPVDSPLLPISRTGFRADFSPSTAMVPSDERRAWHYIDEGRVVVVDLRQLEREQRQASPLGSPAVQP